MKQEFLAEKDKHEIKLKIKKQASIESPTKPMVIASDDSDEENKILSHPKVLEFKKGLLTCIKMIKAKQG